MAVKKSAKSKRKSAGKTTASKATTRKAAGKSTAKRKTAKAKTTTTTTTKLPSVREPMSKSGMIKAITDSTNISKKDVVAVLECFNQVIEKHVKTGGPGKFVLPGILKISVVKKKARPARKGVNPFTGEQITIKAKPASRGVRIRPLKKLKEMVI